VNPAANPNIREVPDAASAAVDQEIYVYGHSPLFYWWPVWVAGFVLAALTYMDGHVMAVVPQGTVVERDRPVPGEGQRDVLVAPPGQAIPAPPPATGAADEPRLRVAATNGYGVVFVFAVLLVALVTSFTFRGLASVVVLIGLVALVLALYVLGWWDPVLRYVGGLDIRMNAGGYLAVAIPLLVMWLFALFVYDRQTYLVFARGQVRLRAEIGDGETALDVTGVVVEKKRDDFFRHWMLGFGSGDLRVKTAGPNGHEYELANVLFVGPKLRAAQDLIKERETTPGGSGS
jgi:hypothetical protein